MNTPNPLHSPAPDMPLYEACVETLEQAVAAERAGAGRIELCARLDLDGITPDQPLIAAVMAAVHIPVHVMVRPRGGNFVYSAAELAQMQADIALCQCCGVAGVVLGVLTPEGQPDLAALQPLLAAAAPLRVVFHKAIDATPDPLASVRLLATLPGLSGILTSGGQATAEAGAAVLRQMVTAAPALQIIAAGRITTANRDAIQALTGCQALHGKRIVGD